jgi:DNA-binding CsgD family transcriptional regulator/transcriptional regulator with XRE-family HTH domain
MKNEFSARIETIVKAGKLGKDIAMGLGYNEKTINKWLRPDPEISEKEIMRYMLLGMTLAEIDKLLGLTYRTTGRWLAERPELRREISRELERLALLKWARRLRPYFMDEKTQTDIAAKYRVTSNTISKWANKLTNQYKKSYPMSNAITEKQKEKIDALIASPKLKVSIDSIIKDITYHRTADLNELTEQEAKDVAGLIKRLIK